MAIRRNTTAVIAAVAVLGSMLGISSIAVGQDRVYHLPAPAGTPLFVTQGNDTGALGGDHSGQSRYAYDFAVDSNEPFQVAAARAGTVQDIRTDVPDGDCPYVTGQTEAPACWSEVNYVVIDHDDGTAALYLHLAQDASAHLGLGVPVAAGEIIGTAGDSGWSKATHLHLMIMGATPWSTETPWWRDSIGPIAFDDASVRATHADGIPGAGMDDDGPFLPHDATAPSTAIGPSGRPIRRPAALPARVPWSAGEAHTLSSAHDPDSPDGFGITVTSIPGDTVYPVFDGEVVYADCASGRSAPLGLMVVVRRELDGHTYDAIYGHLSGIDATLRPTPVIVGPNDAIGRFGSAGETLEEYAPDCAAAGDDGLYVGILRDATISATGEISGGRPVYAEPLVGRGAYEGFSWWDGPMTAIELDDTPGNPAGHWTNRSTRDGASVQYGNPVTLVARVRDSAPIREVRFTAYYPGWARARSAARLDGFDEKKTWRILAVCRPPGVKGEPGKTKGCRWDGTATDATVTYRWDPTKAELEKPAPWQPLSRVAISQRSDQCVPVSLSFDVFDAAGYRRNPAGAKRVQRCRTRTDKPGKVVNLQPLQPPAAPGNVRLACPSSSDRVGAGCRIRARRNVTLHWIDRSGNEDGFYVYVRGRGLDPGRLCTSGGPKELTTRWVQVASLPAGTTSWRTSWNSALRASGAIPADDWGPFTPTADIRVASFNAAGVSPRTGATFLDDTYENIYDCL